LAPTKPDQRRKPEPPRPIDLPQDRYRLNQLRKSRLLKIGDNPFLAIAQRFLLATSLVLLVTLITYFGREGYTDSQGDVPLTFIDSLYYATVSITTTGYGDIVPSTQEARLITTLVVTPIRVVFLVLLVGTTLQVLADKSRFNIRRRNWQKGLVGHTVICGFGIKGQSALRYLRNHRPDCHAVAIDESEEALATANADGVGGVLGSSLETETLRAAGVESASTVIVALESDEDTVVTVIRVKKLNPDAKVVASCREQKNEVLLTASGADEVIISSSSAGRILGMAAQAPDAARIVNDLLTFGDGLDINERRVHRAGESLEESPDQTAIAVVRPLPAGDVTGDGSDDADPSGQVDGRPGGPGQVVFRPGMPGCEPLQPGDRVIFIDSQTGTDGRPAPAGT
jgi:voltage-gated potassium channel